MLKSINSVEYVWILGGKVAAACGLVVQKLRFINSLFSEQSNYTHIIRSLFTALFDSKKSYFVSVNSKFYTVSTAPIKTIYLNKGAYIL